MIGVNLPTHVVALADQGWSWWTCLLIALASAGAYVFGGATIVASLNATGFYGTARNTSCTCRQPSQLFCHDCTHYSLHFERAGYCPYPFCDWDNGWRLTVMVLWPLGIPVGLALLGVALGVTIVAAPIVAAFYLTRRTAVKVGNGVARTLGKTKEVTA